VDPAIGVYIIDRYTYYALDFLEKVTPDSKKTMAQFLRVCPKSQCISTVAVRRDLFDRDPGKVPITDFFGSVRNIELTDKYMVLMNDSLPSQLGGQCTGDSCEDEEEGEEDAAPLPAKQAYLDLFPSELINAPLNRDSHWRRPV